MLHVFRIECFGFAGKCGGNNQAVSVGKGMFPAQLRGREQHSLAPFDNIILLVKSFDEFADFHFGEFYPLDQIDANFIDNLSADDRLGCFDERLGNIFFVRIVSDEGIQPDVGIG